jgi:hypothetical protein
MMIASFFDKQHKAPPFLIGRAAFRSTCEEDIGKARTLSRHAQLGLCPPPPKRGRYHARAAQKSWRRVDDQGLRKIIGGAKFIDGL